MDRTTAEQCLVRLRCNFGSLSTKEKAIAAFILENPSAIKGLSIHKLAALLDVSLGTIVNFCKGLGFSGYRELRRAFFFLPAEYQDLTLKYGPDLEPMDLAEQVWTHALQTLQDTLLVLDREAFNRAARALAASKRISFFARDGSARLAENAARKFIRWGHSVLAYREFDQQKRAASSLGKDSTAIGISYSGKTKEVVECLQIAKEQGAFTIVITSCELSPAAQIGDAVLLGAVRGPEMFGENEFAKLAHVVILDALYFYCIREQIGASHVLTQMRS